MSHCDHCDRMQGSSPLAPRPSAGLSASCVSWTHSLCWPQPRGLLVGSSSCAQSRREAEAAGSPAARGRGSAGLGVLRDGWWRFSQKGCRCPRARGDFTRVVWGKDPTPEQEEDVSLLMPLSVAGVDGPPGGVWTLGGSLCADVPVLPARAVRGAVCLPGGWSVSGRRLPGAPCGGQGRP